MMAQLYPCKNAGKDITHTLPEPEGDRSYPKSDRNYWSGYTIDVLFTDGYVWYTGHCYVVIRRGDVVQEWYAHDDRIVEAVTHWTYLPEIPEEQ